MPSEKTKTTEIKKIPKQDFICYCSGTTKDTLKTLIDGGTDGLNAISRQTGAALGCGSCETNIEEFIAEYKADGGKDPTGA